MRVNESWIRGWVRISTDQTPTEAGEEQSKLNGDGSRRYWFSECWYQDFDSSSVLDRDEHSTTERIFSIRWVIFIDRNQMTESRECTSSWVSKLLLFQLAEYWVLVTSWTNSTICYIVDFMTSSRFPKRGLGLVTLIVWSWMALIMMWSDATGASKINRVKRNLAAAYACLLNLASNINLLLYPSLQTLMKLKWFAFIHLFIRSPNMHSVQYRLLQYLYIYI